MIAPITPVSQLKQKISQLEQSLQRIKEISSKLTFRGKQRINKTALFEVQIKHTNEFTIDLGAGYVAQVRAEEAVKLLQMKIKYNREKISKIEKAQKDNLDAVKGSGLTGKSKAVKINDKEAGYLQCVGEENGQEIFNIVQVEGEDEEEPIQPQKPVSVSQAVEQINPSTKEIAKVSESKNGQSERQTKVESLKPEPQPQIPQKQQIHEQEAEYNDQDDESIVNSNDTEQEDEDDDEECDDIIMSHRAKLTQELDKNKKTQPEPQPQPPVQTAPKTTLPTIIEEQTIEAKSIKQDVQEVPKKISRFKLQKMKQKLQKQL